MERFALIGVMLLIMLMTACLGADEILAPPLVEWDGIMVATVTPDPPSQGDPQVCHDMYEAWDTGSNERIWDTCEDMGTNLKLLIETHLDDDDFRDEDLNCQALKSAMESALGSQSTRSRGLGSYSGISDSDYGVWINEAYVAYPVKEQRLTAAHEAYHLAFPEDDDEDNAEQAANYCFGYSEEHPWGPV